MIGSTKVMSCPISWWIYAPTYTHCSTFWNCWSFYVAVLKVLWYCKILPKKGKNDHFDLELFFGNTSPRGLVKSKQIIHGWVATLSESVV